MITIEYRIKFHTDWHCGSGLAAGADVDALVIKDKDGLPFVPGKTIKGLLREAVDVIAPEKGIDLFGTEESGVETGIISSLFFSNVVMLDEEREPIVKNKVSEYMYRTISSTAINDNGIAKDNSLRKIQVTVPCELKGEIIVMTEKSEEQEKELKDIFSKAFQYIKRLGVGRNRGLGRCTIGFEEGGNQ
jgi:CRISPR/Cas system CSM-associated protein Csm3 (group 7 of RAMP superfamily)